jgi:hypothetical protein
MWLKGRIIVCDYDYEETRPGLCYAAGLYFHFNKLEKNKTLISYFPAHFSWHNQTLESVFQLIFHYTTKHWKIIHFPGIHFPKKNYFPANKRGLRLEKKLLKFASKKCLTHY